MRRAGTTVRPDRGTDHLVMEGSFSFTRNPLYLAGTTLVLGIGLVSGIVWFLLLAVLAAFAVQKLAIEREERHLQARFEKTMWITPSVCGGGSRIMCGTTSLPLKW
jgi:protein-S-isoprenylcysteine O-methyltransferase Ste14